MQHLAIRLAVAFLTFSLGLAASALWAFVSPSSSRGARVWSGRSYSCPSSMRAATVRSETVTVTIPDGRGVAPTITGGLLNNKSISKPAPVYPQAAKDARVGGIVLVRVLVDEAGRVEEATAETGHPLLRSAAVEAVRQWRFTPTLLNGQPVKVSGSVTVDFITR